MADSAPTLFLGRIHTGRRRVEALAVEAGTVVAAGSRAAVRRTLAAGAQVVDLGDHAVLPGLVDSHLHVGPSVLAATGVALRGSTDLEELGRRVRAWSARHPAGPVIGGGWDQEQLGGAWPDQAWLDQLVPDRPAALDRVCGHATLVNSVATEAWGLPEASPGQPPGFLVESEVAQTQPIRDAALRSAGGAMREMMEGWSRNGLTTVADLGASPEELRFLAAEARRAPLPVRLHAYVRLGLWDPRLTAERNSWPAGVSLDGVKVHLDGSLGARTAWLEEPYADAVRERGRSNWDPAALDEALEGPIALGLRPAFHAIGDRALRGALDWLERADRVPGARVEHASVVPPALRSRLAALGVPVAVQPSFRWSDTWLLERLGPARAPWAYPLRSLQSAGITLAGSSDAPVESANPWDGMRAAVDAPDAAASGESLDPRTALDLYSTGAAAALGDPRVGQLEVGSPADLVALATPSFEEALALGGGMPVAGTWRHGRRVAVGPEASR